MLHAGSPCERKRAVSRILWSKSGIGSFPLLPSTVHERVVVVDMQRDHAACGTQHIRPLACMRSCTSPQDHHIPCLHGTVQSAFPRHLEHACKPDPTTLNAYSCLWPPFLLAECLASHYRYFGGTHSLRASITSPSNHSRGYYCPADSQIQVTVHNQPVSQSKPGHCCTVRYIASPRAGGSRRRVQQESRTSSLFLAPPPPNLLPP